MTDRKATAAEVRKHYKTAGYEVRISRDGHIKFRRSRDNYPGASTAWLDGRWVSECFLRNGLLSR